MGYQQITESIAGSIRSGRYRIGSRLPGVRELSARQGVSTNTIAKALAVLAGQGQIMAKKGVGYMVLAAQPRPSVVRSCGADAAGGPVFALADLIRRQRLSPGVFLPGIRALAAELELGTNTVQKAVAVLAASGHLAIVSRIGIRLVKVPGAGAARGQRGRPQRGGARGRQNGP